MGDLRVQVLLATLARTSFADAGHAEVEYSLRLVGVLAYGSREQACGCCPPLLGRS
ncbi:MAG: hypothetical protein LBP35_04395 [Candidatus Ancillula trichonymphae]|nr:hypothetical protein [Candidatus Ancillula trichonymphae]